MCVEAGPAALRACQSLVSQTYTRDIAPIVDRSCAPCHRPGEAGPFSLTDYREVKAHAKQIAAAVRSRIMPPWKPMPGKGEFEGELRLSDAEIQAIEQWVRNGVPEGDPKDRPPPPSFAEGWRLGVPDLIVTLDRPYTLSADGADVFRNFVLRVPVDRSRYVKAVEIRPGARRVVHHANLLIDRERTSRLRDGKDGAPGFAGMDARIETRSFDPESHFLFWKPGTAVLEEPDGMAWQLDPGTDLVLNMHLQPGGKPEMIQPSVGLYFTDTQPVKRPMLVQLEHDGMLDIAPGRQAFEVTDRLTLPVDVDVLGVYPHAHYLARDMQAYAVLPDGSKRWLIHIQDWDINWQAVYRYKRPVFLPKGSVVSMRYTYDNSEGNPRNPSRPPVRVKSGDRSTDEMAHFWMQVLPRARVAGDSRLAMQKAVMLRRLEKYPSDFLAEFSLAAILQTEGRLKDAVAGYRRALASKPDDAAARNALGSALLAMGDLKGASSEFAAAIQAEPDYADARYNLARVLLGENRMEAAVAQLREVIRIEPADAPALSDLGAALLMTGQPAEGFRHLREAVRRRPEYFNGRFNLGQALAAVGRTAEAEAQFREALRIRPGDKDAAEALQRIAK